ncbi:MAG TPA: hypothetical protein VM841_09050 [Actinomycetota bacterium]|nr:hypothetical protein [Actinomycetota bacterium]
MNAPRRFVPLTAVAVVAAYFALASISFDKGLPIRPVYDGVHGPTTYAWVNPPPGQEEGNEKPQPASGRIGLDDRGVKNGTIATPDGQFVITIQEGSIPAKPGQNSIKVDITPLDANKVGKPPADLSYDGNAYRVTAVYLPSNEPATIDAPSCPPDEQPKRCATLVVRYAFGSTALYRRTGSTWTTVEGAQAIPSSLQIFGDSPALGTFVPAGPFTHGEASGGGSRTYIVVLASTVVAAAAAGFTRRGTIKRWWQRRGKKPSRPAPMKQPTKRRR